MIVPDIRTAIQEAMRAAFPAFEERVAQFYAMQEYHLGWRDGNLQPATFDPGKLLRPQLALLACRAVGGDADQALPLAAAIQLIHDFSLIHDDIEDNSDTRRGRVTVWKQWGIAHGINVGDGMFVIAHLALHRLAEVGVSTDVTLEVLKRFDQINLMICEGQFLDMSYEGNLDISIDDYLAMISRKTAALLAGAASLGAIVGGADPESSEALFNFGQSLGLAFQVQDDILGIWGDPAITGKPRAADISRRKVSLPIIHALGQTQMSGGAVLEHVELGHAGRTNTDASGYAELKRIYLQEEVSADDVERVLAILDAAGSRGYCEEIAASYHHQALQCLGRVHTQNDPDAEDALAQMRTMTKKLLGRQT